jgi:hypothetical protein
MPRAKVVVGLSCLVIVVLVGAFLTAPASGYLCDGTYPEWMLDDGYDGSGCIEVRPSQVLEGLLPWNWGAPEVCIGLCGSLEEAYVPNP